MSTERDPDLQALFTAAHQDFDGRAMAQLLTTRIRRAKRKRLALKVLAASVVVALAWVFAAPLQQTALLIINYFHEPIATIDNNLLSQLLAPVNSAAFVVVGLVFIINIVRKKLFG